MAAMVADVKDFDVETDLPRFLKSVHEKAEYICHRNVERRIVSIRQSVYFDQLLTQLTKKF